MTFMSRAAAAVLLAGLALTGCHSPRPADAGPLGLSIAQPATQGIDGAWLYPLSEGAREYDILAGDDAGKRLRFERTQTTGHGAQWKEVTTLVDPESGEETTLRTSFQMRDADGNLVMPAVIDHGDRALTLFKPAMLIAPASLEPGEPVTVDVDMRIVDARNQNIGKEAGNATRTIEIVGTTNLHLADDRRFETVRVRITFSADLRMADAEDTINLFVVPGDGVVAQMRAETVQILRAFNRSTERTIAIVD